MIVTHLTALLTQHDKVVVPRLGTFTVSITNAEMVGEEIVPPHCHITFQEFEVADNHLLKNAVVKAEAISEAEFEEQIKEFVATLRTQITILGSHELKGLGRFFKDDTGTLRFEAEEIQSFMGDSFGLPKIAYQALHSNKPNKEEDEVAVKPSTKKTTAETMTLEDEKEKWKSSELVWWLVVIPLLFVFAFLIYLFTQKDAMDRFRSFFSGGDNAVAVNVSEKKSYENFQGQKPETVITAEQGDNSAKNTPIVKPEREDKEAIDNTTVTTPKKTKTTDNMPKAKEAQSGKFYIVLGSFSSEDKANKAKIGMDNKGVNSMVVSSKDGKLYRVTYGVEFSDEKSASEKIKEVSEKLGIQVWVAKY
jgi:cell division septation protein DedD